MKNMLDIDFDCIDDHHYDYDNHDLVQTVQYNHIVDQINLIKEEKLWRDIRSEAKRNPLLEKALDNIILMYTISK